MRGKVTHNHTTMLSYHIQGDISLLQVSVLYPICPGLAADHFSLINQQLALAFAYALIVQV